MLRIIESTEEEIREVYKQSTKKELIEMLISRDKDLNSVIKNCNLPFVINSKITERFVHVHLCEYDSDMMRFVSKLHPSQIISVQGRTDKYSHMVVYWSE